MIGDDISAEEKATIEQLLGEVRARAGIPARRSG